jgi:predicted ATPase
MTVALERHDALVRGAIESAGGRVVKTVGDAFMAAFTEPAGALNAVIAAQGSVQHELWPDGAPIRVRMALHSGRCIERDGDLFGPVVNRAARLLAVAHGGQILMSAATAGLLADDLPAEATLTDLGLHRLKDLSEPERAYQLCAPGLEDTFPPLRSLNDPALRHNLPYQATSFVGRAEAVAELRTLISSGSRLITLTGAGGVGKTRLALQVAADLVDGTGDGVWLVELASLSDPDLVARAVAGVLGARDRPDKLPVEAVVDVVGDRYLLLVLDNAEHVLDAVAKLADALLRSCPRVHLLVTSREPLGVSGERVVRTPSLSSPPRGERTTADRLADYDAVHLFMERASLARSDFRLDDDDEATAVGELCALLDGIPLAIELAAARLNVMSVAEVRDRLDQRFQILSAGRHERMPRHQTLGALLDWSFELLTPHEQLLLSRLSIFSGGWTLDAATRTCAAAPLDEDQVLPLLSSLVAKSLVQADRVGGATRYRLLETVRLYGRNHLSALGAEELDRTQSAHAQYYLDLAERAESALHGPEQTEWLDQLEGEHDNLRAALATFTELPASPEPAVRLALALKSFWEVRGYYAEGTYALDALLGREDLVQPTTDRARVLNAYCHVRARLGTTALTVARAEEALTIGHRLEDANTAEIIADSHYHLYWHHITHGDAAGALRHAESGLAAAGRSANMHLIARHWMSRAVCRSEQAEELLAADADQTGHSAAGRLVAQARDDYHRSLAVYRSQGDHERALTVLTNLCIGEAHWGPFGDRRAARAQLEEARLLAQRLRTHHLLSDLVCTLAQYQIADGDPRHARAVVIDQLAEEVRNGRNASLPELLLTAVLAGCADQMNPERDATLYGAAEAALQEAGREYFAGDRSIREHVVASMRAALGDRTFEAAVAAGHALALADVVALATQDDDLAASEESSA